MLAGTGIPSIGLIRRLTCLRSQGCFSRRGTRARRESFTVTTLHMIPKGRLSIWSVKYLRTNTACIAKLHGCTSHCPAHKQAYCKYPGHAGCTVLQTGIKGLPQKG